jgi:hypothetical protein
VFALCSAWSRALPNETACCEFVGLALSGDCYSGQPERVWEGPEQTNVVDISMHVTSPFFCVYIPIWWGCEGKWEGMNVEKNLIEKRKRKIAWLVFFYFT